MSEYLHLQCEFLYRLLSGDRAGAGTTMLRAQFLWDGALEAEPRRLLAPYEAYSNALVHRVAHLINPREVSAPDPDVYSAASAALERVAPHYQAVCAATGHVP